MKKTNWILILIYIFSYLVSTNVLAQDIENIEKEKPIQLVGSFSIFGSYYNVNGIDPRRKDFSWYLTGNPIVKI